MAQFLRPAANVTQTGVTGGFAEIDEVTASDADVAFGTAGGGNVLEVELSDVNPPAAGFATIRYRHSKGNGSALANSGSACDLTVELIEDGVVISSEVRALGATATNSFQVLTAALVNWNNARLRFSDSSHGGNPSNRRNMRIHWAEIEIPDGTVQRTAAASLTLAPATTTSAARLGLGAASSMALAAATMTSAGALPVGATSAMTLAPTTMTATGTLPAFGAASMTLAPATLVSASSSQAQGEGEVTATLAPASMLSDGSLGLSAAASAALSPASMSSAAELAIASSSSMTLAPASTSSASALSLEGSSGATLAPATMSSSASLPVGASSSMSTEPATMSATAELADPNGGVVSATLAPAEALSGGALSIVSSASMTLSPALGSGAGELLVSGGGGGQLEPGAVIAQGGPPQGKPKTPQIRRARQWQGSRIATAAELSDISMRTAGPIGGSRIARATR